MPKRRPKIHEVTLAAMSRVKMAELRLQAFKFAMQGLDRYDSQDKTVANASSVIYGKLYEQHSRAMSDVFMFGMFSDKQLKNIKKRTLDMLLKENQSLGYYYREDTPFTSGNSYNTKVEEELRNELEKERLELQGKNSEPWHERFDERGTTTGE